MGKIDTPIRPRAFLQRPANPLSADTRGVRSTHNETGEVREFWGKDYAEAIAKADAAGH